MAQNPFAPHLALPAVSDLDEVDAVLTVLRALAKQVTSPVVQACLDAARADIAYLTAVDNTDGDPLEDEDCADGEDCTGSAAA